MTIQATIGTNVDGTLLITNATEGITIQDAQSFNTIIKEIAGGLQLTVNDGAVSTVYEIISGKLKNIMEITAKVNGTLNQAITDEITAANYYPREGQIIESAGSSYQVISVDSNVTDNEYNINLNDLGRLAFEGQISLTVNAALTAELVKLGRRNWTIGERIAYLDGTAKTMDVLWAKFDTENKKYIVNCGELS